MSLLGTAAGRGARAGAGAAGSRLHAAMRAGARATRCVLNVLRAIPELVWAALLLIAAGLGPFAGTLALALHTTGVLGRLFAEAIENAPPGPADALRAQGVGAAACRCLYATLPQVLPQLASYTLYRWENNIRAAAVLGVVGAGGLGQLLAFHMGLFQMGKTATILAAMLLLVAAGRRHQRRRAAADDALNAGARGATRFTKRRAATSRTGGRRRRGARQNPARHEDPAHRCRRIHRHARRRCACSTAATRSSASTT
ncbi:MAG: ABC transporter permease subunit [Comamonadaceae bacterium]|nr:ABC transporter permease subunit [Comamonadaceae bacterium]